ncbi:chromatin associated protein KTI12 [Rhizopus microsporus ATCC 52813]|uniref:Chromatin associated protein KTI12 n=1 Tax=Rhizopus microsporus ATCC 52813 TaxID=1340429 RepID=A0A2G4SHR8_RHIZD|nr:chromatin associated protein KTI12 [Rhizopus microsporus ATCC 52813]PHZ08314.1 chromatin associated protein KTI12 [Rhizopus microsporus ATCC 52813]
MPLIVLTGYPSSGKTQRTNEIKEYLTKKLAGENKSLRIHIIDDHSLHVPKTAYKDAREEKKARGALLSAVERLLSKDDIVIADGLNYIKGFRYQLYCVARAIGTPHCVVHTGVPADIAKEWNTSRNDERYDDIVFDELVSRYEEPDERNRWDSPLFTIIYDDKEIPGDKLWDAVILKKPPPPNKSTVSKPVSSTNYVYELDKATLEIINAFVEQQKELGPGGMPMTVPRSTVKVINPSRTVTLSELRRLRKQFVTYNKMNTTLDVNRLGDVFVEYLNTNLE